MEIDTSQLLNILSLCIALLAVIVSPLVSWLVSKRQFETSLHISNKQVMAPIKKEWVESLQNYVAELLSTSLWFYVSEEDLSQNSSDTEEYEDASERVEKKLLLIMSQIELMLDPTNDHHNNLLKSLKATYYSMWHGNEEFLKFPDYHKESVKICQTVIKDELLRIQSEIKEI